MPYACQSASGETTEMGVCIGEIFVFATLVFSHYVFVTFAFVLLRGKTKTKTTTVGAKRKNDTTPFLFCFCPTKDKNDVLPETDRAKTKYQNLEWQKQNGQKLKWQQQNFPIS